MEGKSLCVKSKKWGGGSSVKRWRAMVAQHEDHRRLQKVKEENFLAQMPLYAVLCCAVLCFAMGHTCIAHTVHFKFINKIPPI
jgi:hypothetical protein